MGGSESYGIVGGVEGIRISGELLCNWWVPACWETAGMGCSHTFAEELTTAAPIALQCSAGQAENTQGMAMPFYKEARVRKVSP
ncbi:MAG: hypothetical protein JJT78_05320 [Leptospira sp.]|nr:hypothetical protein [Leptospira sp.]